MSNKPVSPVLIAKALLVVEDRKGKPKEDDWELAEAAEYLAQGYKELLASRNPAYPVRLEYPISYRPDETGQVRVMLYKDIVLSISPTLDMNISIDSRKIESGVTEYLLESVECIYVDDSSSKVTLELYGSTPDEDGPKGPVASYPEQSPFLKRLLSLGWNFVPDERNEDASKQDQNASTNTSGEEPSNSSRTES